MLFRSQVKKELKSFCRALNDGDAHAAYSLTTHTYQAAESEQVFAANILGGYPRADSCTHAKLTAGSQDAAATLTITTGIPPGHHRINQLVYEWDVKLVKHGSKWLIAQLKPER